MTIVLNEHEWAAEMIKARSLGKKPFETFIRIARYYIDNGMPRREVRRKMDMFLIQSDPTASIPKWSDTLDYALEQAMKYPAVDIKSIDITDKEMAKIDAIKGKQMRRLAFTLLCLAKYWDIVGTSSDHWVNTRDSDIMRMANINTSIKRQSLMYYNLNASGLIQFSRRVDNTNVRVLFMEPGKVVMRVTDFRNLGYQYLKFHGEPYFECKNCGVMTKLDKLYECRDGKVIFASGRKQKYCKACAAEIATQQNVNSVMRLRCAEVPS